MAGEAVWLDGTELILETTASSASISDGVFRECDSDDRQPGDDPGYPFARFEFDTDAGGFSAAPTAGAVINIYEQTINSDSADSPDPASTNIAGYIGTIAIVPSDTQQKWVTKPLSINPTGGKYWIEWLDGGSGTASVDAGWELRMIPTTYNPAA